ncbi:MAG: type I restriction endonuclease subunit R [Bacteroidota bacterium]|nr:type I restriction endonuclease subunit R [Bacteroidota bacterium]
MSTFSENILVEQPTIELFKSLKWQFQDCYEEFNHAGGSPLGRDTKSDVVLVERLREALVRLNNEAPEEAIHFAIEELTKDRSSLTLVNANKEIYHHLKSGITYTSTEQEEPIRIRVIDWNDHTQNDYLLCSQFWITGTFHTRRADLIGFINGLPLVFIELKAVHKRLENAYHDNLRDYKDTIPHIFWYNAFIILSNGSQSKTGTISSEFEHFAEWKKINSEGETGIVSLDTMIKGTCERQRILDIIENFILYTDTRSGTIKLLGKYHQYFGVNAAITQVETIKKNKGRLGVFWHTQGSGKSYSMVFFAQKVLRKLGSNYTFLVVTDREDLDRQIYKNFANAGVVKEAENRARAQSANHLQELLKEDHRYLFTLIQKFRSEPGTTYPVLSERSDIIVMTDEAHRTQYDVLALNMRNAIPQAAFIGFTGTPLIAGEERTKEVFGDYVSVYDFKQSIDDNATVPLYYENRIPELQLLDDGLEDKLAQIVDESDLDEDQEKKLEREFSREYHLITRDDRLEKIAEDIVHHFTGRGQEGKAMVISIDRITAVKMYDKVKKHWSLYQKELEKKLLQAQDETEREPLIAKIEMMQKTDMAVIVSSTQNEIDDFKNKGMDILPHRERMLKESLDEEFKDPAHPLRIVFVCAMWITGFDVPSCSTIYLDKPMKNHTLMQTIARANRVFGEKVNGLIVDYVGVFRNLKKALAIYAAGGTGGEIPVKDKQELVAALRWNLIEADKFCKKHNVKIDDVISADALHKIKLLDDAAESLIVNEATKKQFIGMANLVQRLFKAILPDASANEHKPHRDVILTIAEKIKSTAPDVDISAVVTKIEKLLDASVKIQEGAISDVKGQYGKKIDLSKVDFDKLREQFEKSRKRTEFERLKTAITEKILMMVVINRSRLNLLEKFQAMIEEYNNGSASTEAIYEELLKFAQELNEEEKRHIKEELTEEELAIFDILMKPAPALSTREINKIKKIAKEMLEILKREKFGLEWRRRQQTRASVLLTIQDYLDQLPEEFTPELYQEKCNSVYQFVYEAY